MGPGHPQCKHIAVGWECARFLGIWGWVEGSLLEVTGPQHLWSVTEGEAPQGCPCWHMGNAGRASMCLHNETSSVSSPTLALCQVLPRGRPPAPVKARLCVRLCTAGHSGHLC